MKDKIIGHYRIVDDEPLGEGGQGKVYKAENINPPHQKVAIKTGPDAHMIIREAKSMASFDHDNLAKIIEWFEEGDANYPYVVMEYVPDGLLDHFATKDKTVLQKSEIILKLAKALDYANGKGFLHRDIKPANILLKMKDQKPGSEEDPEFEPKIVDWGLAKDYNQTETIMDGGGTLFYSAPEQLTGQKEISDHRADIYSLGIVFYELLAKSDIEEIKSEFFDQLSASITAPIPPILPSKNLPLEICDIVNRSISYDVADRYQTWGEFIKLLAQFCETVKPENNNTIIKEIIHRIDTSNRLSKTGLRLTGISIVIGMTLLVFRFTFLWEDIGDLLNPNDSITGAPDTAVIAQPDSTDPVYTPTSVLLKQTEVIVPAPKIWEKVATPQPSVDKSENTVFYFEPVEADVIAGEDIVLFSKGKEIVIEVPRDSYKNRYKLILRTIVPAQVQNLPEKYNEAFVIFNLSVVSDGVINQQGFSFDNSLKVNVGFNNSDTRAGSSIPSFLRQVNNNWELLETYKYPDRSVIFTNTDKVGVFAVATNR